MTDALPHHRQKYVDMMRECIADAAKIENADAAIQVQIACALFATRTRD